MRGFFLLANERAFVGKRQQSGLAHSSTACEFGGSSNAFDSMPDLCDERRTYVTGPSYVRSSLESPEGSVSCKDPDIQSGINLESLESGHGADNLYGDATDTSGDWLSADATVPKPTGSQIMTTSSFGETRTVTPTQETSWSLDPDLPNGSSSQKNCTCISCLGIGIDWYLAPYVNLKGYKCRFPGCLTFSGSSHIDHERCHYGEQGKYTCLEQNCQVVTKNFSDLKRHYKVKHCTNPNKEQFPCPEVWCKYSGDNGFARKDKLQSHYRNIHEGKPGPAKAGRVLKPATFRPKVSGPEGSASKQEEHGSR